MDEEGKSSIQQLMSQTKCDNDFRCCKSGFKNLCAAKVIGDGQLLDCSNCDHAGCLRPNPKDCNYRTPFGFGYFCTCPLRIYAAQHPNH
jgi:hypothetical protein